MQDVKRYTGNCNCNLEVFEKNCWRGKVKGLVLWSSVFNNKKVLDIYKNISKNIQFNSKLYII